VGVESDEMISAKFSWAKNMLEPKHMRRMLAGLREQSFELD